MGHSDDVANGVSTSLRVPLVVQSPIRMPDVNRNVPVPRRMMLRQANFNEHGLTAGCPGCQWLTHKIGNSKNNTEDSQKLIEDAFVEK